MKFLNSVSGLVMMSVSSMVFAEAKEVETPYQEEQKVLFDFYLDDPAKISSALYWLRSFLHPLIGPPRSYAPDFMNIIVLIHGTEIVTLVKKNRSRFKTDVQRMEYYADLGVKFRVCGLAMVDYGYVAKDFYDFVEIVPSGITELAHWQQQGYAIIQPKILSKNYTIEEIR